MSYVLRVLKMCALNFAKAFLTLNVALRKYSLVTSVLDHKWRSTNRDVPAFEMSIITNRLHHEILMKRFQKNYDRYYVS